jgi:formylglycine-generating enzyme required for sulfatase activity
MLMEAPLHAQTSGKRVALLVGVNHYDKRGFRDLEYAERDVEELAGVLKPAGYDVHLLTGSAKDDSRAELKNVQKAIETILTGRKKEDLILIALAGHGLQIEVTGADGKLRAESFYCPADAEQGNAKTMLAMGKLFEEIDRRGGGHNLVLVDACREDPTRGRGLDGSRVQALPEGVAVLFGCRAGQKTFETKNAGGGHGVFFHFVLEGLGGKARNDRGQVTWDRLVEYVRERVEDGAPELLGDKTLAQTPNLIANLPGRSPILLPSLPPKLLVAPFGERTAKARQEAWKRFLGKAEVIEENSIGMKLVLVPPGEFLMGTSEEEVEQTLKDLSGTKREWMEDEKQHRVRITRPFLMGVHEVTVGQFRRFFQADRYTTEAERDGEGGMGYNEDAKEFQRGPQYTWKNTGWRQTDDHPVVNVSWNDVEAFCKWLSKKEGRTYRLPSEAEFEYACRAGTTTRYYHGDDPEGLARVGNVNDATAKDMFPRFTDTIEARDGHVFTAPVGQYPANALGLCDLHGNVREWCQDWYRKDYEALPTDDPLNDKPATLRVIRNGAWGDGAGGNRSADRLVLGKPSSRSHAWGFRVVVSPVK